MLPATSSKACLFRSWRRTGCLGSGIRLSIEIPDSCDPVQPLSTSVETALPRSSHSWREYVSADSEGSAQYQSDKWESIQEGVQSGPIGCIFPVPSQSGESMDEQLELAMYYEHSRVRVLEAYWQVWEAQQVMEYLAADRKDEGNEGQERDGQERPVRSGNQPRYQTERGKIGWDEGLWKSLLGLGPWLRRSPKACDGEGVPVPLASA